MRMKALLGGFAAAALAAQPISAAAVSRAAAPSESESELGGSGALLGILVFAALVAGFLIIGESDENDEPISA